MAETGHPRTIHGSDLHKRSPERMKRRPQPPCYRPAADRPRTGPTDTARARAATGKAPRARGAFLMIDGSGPAERHGGGGGI